MHTTSTNQRGFTLIELLVVIAIIGILAGLVVTTLSGAKAKTRDAVRKSDLRNIQTALELYNDDVQRYPIPVGSTTNACLDFSTNAFKEEISPTTAGKTQYMKKVPVDPFKVSNPTQPEYCYAATVTGTDYQVWAKLENANDPDNNKIPNPGLFNQPGPNGRKYFLENS